MMSKVLPAVTSSDWNNDCTLFKQAMQPFWTTNVIFNESVLMVRKGNEHPHATLYFEPEKIVSVKNAYLNIEYQEGIDWIYENGHLMLTEQSQAAFMTEDEFIFSAPAEGATYPAVGGKHLLWNRNNSQRLLDKQLAVTYQHTGSWEGPKPKSSADQLVKTKEKLANGAPLKIVMYGDSIAVGAESSRWHHIPPFMPTWGELVVKRLNDCCDSAISFINASSGGKTSEWGADNVPSLVSKAQPDLVIVAFGMNDGSMRVNAEQYEDNIRRIIENVKQSNPNAEFIVVSAMLPNPELNIAAKGTHRTFLPVLQRLISHDIALADLTSVTAALLQRKKFLDITSNNVNHPNDYLIRWYAQTVSALLI